ncbi:MAG TPA: hypothetical protein VII75_03190 [Thermoanaerobaculia bacterium]
MRYTFIALLFMTIAGAAYAQSAPPPDYSADHLRQIFSTQPAGDEPLPQRNVHFGFGTIEFRALGMDWRIGFLPILAPLPGSVPGTTNHLPDAFSLNHLVIPGAPPPVERTADMKRELRRIARLTAARNAR